MAVAIVILSSCNAVRCDQGEICSAEEFEDDHGPYDGGMGHALGHLTTDTSVYGYDCYIASPGPPIMSMLMEFAIVD